MSDDDKPLKINIGFAGGPVLSARVQPKHLQKLRDALGTTGWHQVNAEDGEVSVNLEKIVYLLVDTEAHRVGFGG